MLIALLTSVLLVMLAVLVHYQILHRLSLLLPNIKIRPQFHTVIAVLGALVAHVLEVWIFAIGYDFLTAIELTGSLTGSFTGTILDCGYYSFVTYTSLGFGDIIPVGYLRFITGIEALTGLVLIAWTASFVYVQIQR
ncbi:MAG: two pore domain potassium channel family protein, partial [Gammaproteobacteria bacterium]|nr:two pore domain potassium channel family protein [Gammaproteobacteria bacterium]